MWPIVGILFFPGPCRVAFPAAKVALLYKAGCNHLDLLGSDRIKPAPVVSNLHLFLLVASAGLRGEWLVSQEACAVSSLQEMTVCGLEPLE